MKIISKKDMAPFKKLLKPLMKPILMIVKYVTSIINYIKCGIKILTNFSTCIWYYIPDSIGYVLYLLPSLFFWIFSLGELEKQLWKMIYAFDDICFDMTGFHIFKYSNSIMNKCYRCKNKSEKQDGYDWLANMETGHYSFFQFVLLVFLILFIFFYFFYGMSSKNI